MNNQTDTQDTYPPLPYPAMEDVPYELWGQNAVHAALFTAAQMRFYVDADRTLRAGQSEPVAWGRAGSGRALAAWHELPDTRYESSDLFNIPLYLGGAGQSPTVPTDAQLTEWIAEAQSTYQSTLRQHRFVLDLARTTGGKGS